MHSKETLTIAKEASPHPDEVKLFKRLSLRRSQGSGLYNGHFNSKVGINLRNLKYKSNHLIKTILTASGCEHQAAV